MKKGKDKKLIIAIVVSVIAITLVAGITYAVFSYSKSGIKGNSITSGNIVFHYGEGGRSISLENAMPMTEAQGKAQNNYFDFTITSKTNTGTKIPYTVTVKRKGNDSSLDSGIKLYLTEVANNTETDVYLDNNKIVSKYSELATYTNTSLNIDATKNEKVLYKTTVPQNANNYEKNYRLRMWVSDDYNFSQTVTGSCSDPTYTTRETCVAANKDWTDVATSTAKTFTATINVYSEGGATNARNLAQMIREDNTLKTTAPDFTKAEPATIYNAGTFDTTPRSYNKTNAQDNYMTYSASFTLNPTTGRYTLDNPQTCKWSECYNDLIGKYIVNTSGNSTNGLSTTSDLFGLYKVTSETTQNTLYAVYDSYSTTYDNTNSGFYSMNVTDGYGGADGTTYYFRGEVNNNYVQFGISPTGKYIGRFNDYPNYVVGIYGTLEECQHGSAYGMGVDYCDVEVPAGGPMLWRVVRINEDGTVRLILNDPLSLSNGYTEDNKFNDTYNNYMSMYYSNSNLKGGVTNWYNTTITGEDRQKVATGNYFCEAAKVKCTDCDDTAGSATMTSVDSYTPDLKCITDGNSKGLVNASAALITYDEVVLAGGYLNEHNPNYYLSLDSEWWTMSSSGVYQNRAAAWRLNNGPGDLTELGVINYQALRPVINLKADVTATGTGTISDPYVVD